MAFPRISLATETANGVASGQFRIKTNTSGQIGVRSNAPSTEVYLSITGWVDLPEDRKADYTGFVAPYLVAASPGQRTSVVSGVTE